MNGLYDLGPVVAVPLLVLRYAHAVGGLGVTTHRRQADWLTENTPVNTSAAYRLIDEVVQSRRRPLLGPSPG